MNARLVLKLGAALVLAAAVIWWLPSLGMLAKWLEPERAADLLAEAGAAGPLLLIGLVAVAVVVAPIPSVPIDIAAGVAYGPWLGTLYVSIGALAGAVASFQIARLLGREALERVLRGHISFCQECSDKLLTRVVFAARLAPAISFDLISYGAGLTKMSLGRFALATWIGMLPWTFAYVAFGASVLDVLARNTPLLIALGLAVVALFLLLPRWIERFDLFGLREVFKH